MNAQPFRLEIILVLHKMFYTEILRRDSWVSQQLTSHLNTFFTRSLSCFLISDLIHISSDEQKIEFISLNVVVLVSEDLLHGDIKLQGSYFGFISQNYIARQEKNRRSQSL